MEQFWRSRKFKVSLQEWNKKLEDIGFEDAEVELKGDRALKQRATNCYKQASELERESRLEYFTFIGHLANNTKFPDEVEEFVMLKHSEGFSIAEIVAELSDINRPRHRHTVGFIIKRWQTKWGVRSWSLRQMNLKK